MATGIMIMGSSGAGKTTLGELVAKELGYTFVDIDEYIWRKDTNIPFSAMYPRPEKISRLMDAISQCEHFVMAGSMDSFHEQFDPFFELVVHLHTDAQIRAQRVHERELQRFGERILEGGDMHIEHQKYLNDISGYDFGIGGCTLQQHELWLQSLKCKVLRLDGSNALKENMDKIMEAYRDRQTPISRRRNDMGTGIQICGLNGCGKSTLGKALAERMDFHFIDNEHLYFSRTHADEPYTNPRSRAEVERLLMEEVRIHPDFVFSAVKGDYGEEIIPLYSYVVVMEVPKDIRSQRVRNRSFQKFGSRMLAGGDLHSQEEAFFQLAESRRDDDIERWLQQVNCPVIRVDGTKPIEENVESILRAIGGCHASGSQAR